VKTSDKPRKDVTRLQLSKFFPYSSSLLNSSESRNKCAGYTPTNMDLNISAHTKHALTDLNDSLPVDALSAKKRKLALVKCDRCRDDKVKVSDSEFSLSCTWFWVQKPLRTSSSSRSYSVALNQLVTKCLQCLPIERTFPEKCIRCEEKDLPCSAGKKAERKGKHVLKEPSPPLPSSAESADGKKFDDRFEEW
jgi:hypothetical protein